MMTNEDELKTSISKFYHALNSLFEGETRAMKNAWLIKYFYYTFIYNSVYIESKFSLSLELLL